MENVFTETKKRKNVTETKKRKNVTETKKRKNVTETKKRKIDKNENKRAKCTKNELTKHEYIEPMSEKVKRFYL